MRSILSRLKNDGRGAAIVEFAILAPVLFAMVFGVIQVGIQMWSYNSLRSIVADTVRYTAVEYQKGNQITTAQIETKAVAIAVNSPYDFKIDNLGTVQATPISSGDPDYISGLTGYRLTMSYTPPAVLDFTGITAPTISISRPIYVS